MLLTRYAAGRAAFVRFWDFVSQRLAPGAPFCVALGLIEAMTLDLNFKPLAWSILTLQFGIAMVPVALSLTSVIGLSWFGTLVRRSRVQVRVTASVAASLSFAYEYSYQKTLGRFSAADDMVIAFNVTNAEHKWDAILTYVDAAVLVPVTLFTVLLATRPLKPSASSREWIGFGLAAIAWGAASWDAAKSDPGEWAIDRTLVLSLPNTLKTSVSYSLDEVFAFRGVREGVPSRPTRPSVDKIVLVIDEAVNASHLSLNGYSRRTTPFLEELEEQGKLFNWGTTVAATTCSHSSGMFLYSGLRMSDLPDIGELALRRATIFQWAKAAGYSTYFLDGQMTSYWIGPPKDLEYVDSWQPASEFGAFDADRHLVDIRIARRIRQILAKSGERQFIFVWKSGLHYPYYRRFPASSASWTPYWTGRTVSIQHLGELINAYDNGIRWSTDEFFRTLVTDLSIPAESLRVLYTSDHGQALGRTGGAASHCGDSSFEVEVPLFLLGPTPSLLNPGYRASHENVFPTIAELMGYELARDSVPSLLQAHSSDNRPRYHVGANLRDGGKHLFPENQRPPR